MYLGQIVKLWINSIRVSTLLCWLWRCWKLRLLWSRRWRSWSLWRCLGWQESFYLWLPFLCSISRLWLTRILRTILWGDEGFSEWMTQGCGCCPNVLLAISFQANIFPIYKGMRKASDSRMSKVVLVRVIFCTSTYLMIGIMGYNYFGENASANFLNSLSY